MNIPKMGQGTWQLGDCKENYGREIKSIRLAIENGLTLIDTAEMYGDGNSEFLVGEAIKPYKREDLFIVSKVYPFNAGKHIYNSLRKSLHRLQTTYLDLYLLHWRGSIPLRETIYHMEKLVAQGLIRAWGVSNFDTDDMKELLREEKGGNCAVNQVLYNLASRGIEYSLLPLLKEHGIRLMAYCPISPSKSIYRDIKENNIVKEIADKNKLTIPQLLLSFINYRGDMIPIPRTSNPDHALENAKMLDFNLSREDYEALDQEFPPPKFKTPLHIV